MAKEKKFITCDGNTAAAHVSYMFTSRPRRHRWSGNYHGTHAC